MMVVARLTPLFLAIAVCLSPARAQAPDKLTATAERVIAPLLKQHDVPGIAVGVTVNGRRYFFNYGVASKELGTLVTQDTLFEIGSISKTVAATLAGYAVATGRMSLDDHPGQYMPALKGAPIDKATLLLLGTYTAGGLLLLFPKTMKTDTDAIPFLQKWQPSSPFGTQRRYSNPSLGLFGHVAALALKRDYTELVEREIFPRLGLTHSYIRVPQAAMAHYAQGYDRNNKPARAGSAPFAAEAFGVKSSTADMVKYLEANMKPAALDADIRRAIEGTHLGYFKVGEMVQGLGWEQYPYPVTLQQLLAGNSDRMVFEPNAATALTPPRKPSEPTLFNKTGSTRGFGAYAAFVPDRQIGVVILSNRNMPTPARITAAHALLETLAGL